MKTSNNQPKENLSFKIGISGTFWDKKPECSILINNIPITHFFADNEIRYIEFVHEFDENSKNKICIRLENKEDSDTVENLDKSGFIKDMLLNIESIEIDDISLDSLLWSVSKFIPDDNSRPILKQCVNLGWNGTYIIEFTTPFYLWLLENI